MQTNFWFGTSLEDFIFSGYDITTPLGLTMTCVALVTLSIFLEVLKLKVQTMAVKQSSKIRSLIHSHVCPDECRSSVAANVGQHPRYGEQVLQVLLYTMQSIVGYLLMLAVMTYNGYLILSVVLGGGLGYLLFGQGFMVIQLKNAVLKKHCPGCKDECGDQQCEEIAAALSDSETKFLAVLDQRKRQENDETDHILETCSC